MGRFGSWASGRVTSAIKSAPSKAVGAIKDKALGAIKDYAVEKVGGVIKDKINESYGDLTISEVAQKLPIDVNGLKDSAVNLIPQLNVPMVKELGDGIGSIAKEFGVNIDDVGNTTIGSLIGGNDDE